MKKVTILMWMLFLMLIGSTVNAEETTWVKSNSTAYVMGHTTATGIKAESFIETEHGYLALVAWKKEYLHKKVKIYQRMKDGTVGRLLATCIVEDICPAGNIDIRRDDMEAAQRWMDLVYEDGCKGKVWVEVYE